MVNLKVYILLVLALAPRQWKVSLMEVQKTIGVQVTPNNGTSKMDNLPTITGCSDAVAK